MEKIHRSNGIKTSFKRGKIRVARVLSAYYQGIMRTVGIGRNGKTPFCSIQLCGRYNFRVVRIGRNQIFVLMFASREISLYLPKCKQERRFVLTNLNLKEYGKIIIH